jgi:branched-chain amino acid transport system substrate-binding protein
MGETGADGNGGRTPADNTDGGAALEGETIKLGVMTPKEASSGGLSMFRGYEMAVEALNANGGIAGAEVKMIDRATGGVPAQGSQAFRELVLNEEVDLVTGIVEDTVALQSFPTMRDTKTLMIAASTLGLRQTRLVRDRYDEFKYHFRTLPNALSLAEGYLEWVKWGTENLGWDRIALLTENVATYDFFHEYFEENLGDFVEVTSSTRGSLGTTDYTPHFDRWEDEDIDYALVNLAITGGQAAVQWANQQPSFEFGGIHPQAMEAPYWEETNGRTRYIFSLSGLAPTSKNTPHTQSFIGEYEDRHGVPPQFQAGFAWDTVKVIKETFELVVEAEGISSVPDSETMIPYMENEVELDVEDTDFVSYRHFTWREKDHEYPHDPEYKCAAPSTCGEDAWYVPIVFQWQRDDEGSGTQETIFPREPDRVDYAFPHWIEYPSDHPANDPDAPGYQPSS